MALFGSHPVAGQVGKFRDGKGGTVQKLITAQPGYSLQIRVARQRIPVFDVEGRSFATQTKTKIHEK